MIHDMPSLRGGDIVPGERIGIFTLGMSWPDLRASLVGAYAVAQRAAGFTVKTATLWFWFDDGRTLSQITAVGRFGGRVGGAVGIGSTLPDVAAALGAWRADEDDTIVVAACPGVCFELGRVPGHDAAWQLAHAPIEFISVYPGSGSRSGA